MKKLIALLMMLTANVVANADNDQSMHQEMFDQFKQMNMEGIQNRISIEQNNLACVQAAQKREDMQKCEETARAAMETFRKNQQQKMQTLMNNMKQQPQQNNNTDK